MAILGFGNFIKTKAILGFGNFIKTSNISPYMREIDQNRLKMTILVKLLTCYFCKNIQIVKKSKIPIFPPYMREMDENCPFWTNLVRY